MTVEAELNTAIASAQIVRFELLEPVDHVKVSSERFWIDLCLTPRPADASGCYPARWGQQRFERLGELFMVPPGAAMHARASRGTQTSIVCQLNGAVMEKWLEREYDWTNWRLEAGLHISDPSIRGLLMRLTREVSRPALASETVVELLAMQLAIELARYCGSIADKPEKGGLAAWRLRLIEQRAQELGKAPSLDELADLCNLSVRQLSRGFRASRGCSIGEYVEQTRIENAKRLLINGQSVKSVAYSMGFATPQSFSFAFRRTTGVCPAEYRRLA